MEETGRSKRYSKRRVPGAMVQEGVGGYTDGGALENAFSAVHGKHARSENEQDYVRPWLDRTKYIFKKSMGARERG